MFKKKEAFVFRDKQKYKRVFEKKERQRFRKERVIVEQINPLELNYYFYLQYVYSFTFIFSLSVVQ